jgi:hypothetical protein
MATHRLPITNFINPDDSGEVFLAPYSVFATNDQWKHLVIRMNDDDTNRVGFYGQFEVPQNYVDTASIVVVWTAQVTSNNAVFDFDYRAVGGNDTESLDQSGTQESVSTTDAAPSAVNERLEAELTVTDGNFAAGDTVEYFFALDGSDASCTISDVLQIFGLFFKFNDA